MMTPIPTAMKYLLILTASAVALLALPDQAHAQHNLLQEWKTRFEQAQRKLADDETNPAAPKQALIDDLLVLVELYQETNAPFFDQEKTEKSHVYLDRSILLADTGPGDSAVISVIERHATTLADRSRGMASQLHLVALKVSHKVNAPDLGDTYICAMSYLKFLSPHPEEFASASETLNNMLSEWRKNNSGDSGLIGLLIVLGDLEIMRKNYVAARTKMEEAYELAQKYPSENPEISKTVARELILIAFRSGDYRHAAKLIKQFNDSLTLPGSTPFISNRPDSNELANLNAGGDHAGAINLARQQLANLKQNATASPANIAYREGQLAEQLHSQQQFDEAESLYLNALTDIGAPSWTDAQRQKARWQSDLGQLYRAKRDWAKAEQYQKLAYDASIAMYPANYPECMDSLSELAFLYTMQGRNEEAETAYRSLLETAKNDPDAQTSTIASYTWALGDVLMTEGKTADALTQYEATITVWGNSTEKSEQLDAMRRLLAIYKKQGMKEKSKALEQKIAVLSKH